MALVENDISILVIEDNLGDYVLIEEYLIEETLNAKIHRAKTFAEAKEYLSSGQYYDSILLDLSLPDAQGEELVNETIKLAGVTPVIVLTGYFNVDFGIKTLSLGISDYLMKDGLQAPLLVKSIAYSIERKRISTALINSEKKYKDLFQFNPLPMWVYDPSTLFFLNVNQAAIDHYGYSEKEFLNMTITGIRVAKHTDRLKEIISEEDHSGSTKKSNWKHITKDKREIDVEVSSKHIQFGDKPARLVLVNDITEKLETSRQQLELNKRLNAAQKIAKLGYWEVDIRTKQLFWSDEVYKIFQLSKDLYDPTYDTLLDMVHPDDRKIFEQKIKETISGGSALELNHRIICPDGSVKHVYEQGKLVYEDNKPIRFEGTVQDITERVRYETERELMINELTQNNKDLRQFSYITSHNLKAPLSNLTGLLKLLDYADIPEDNEELTEILKAFKSSTHTLNTTIEDLEKILIIKDNPSIEQDKLLLEDIFGNVLEQTKHLVEECKPLIKFDLARAPSIRFNKVYLESIFLNLLTNALKYRSASRRLIITITAIDEGDHIQILFMDNGVGLDAKRHKNKLFGLYQKFHDHPESKGMGLYMVRTQMEAMGGKIEMFSEVDKGATFKLKFKKYPDVG